MAAVPVYDKSGARAGELEVPEVFGFGRQPQCRAPGGVGRIGRTAPGHVEGQACGEVAGSGKKLWRQKGTGRARVGDRRPPNRVGGGTVTGPGPGITISAPP